MNIQIETTDDDAIVIGGSLAGLLAARVLSDHFKNVTLVDRDTFPEAPGFRNGVPQSRHNHVLLLKGRAILEDFFPGFTDDLVARGAVAADVGSEFLSVTLFGRLATVETGLNLYLCSRHLVEWCVRKRVAEVPNVRFLARTEVTGLLTADANQRVVGVSLRSRSIADGPAELRAGFVVDCSGRGSPVPGWLQGMGFSAPVTTTVNSHLGYSSRWYRMPEKPPAWKGILISNRPPDNPCGGGILPAEDGAWIVTLAGNAGAYPPTDEEGFHEFLSRVPDPALAEAIRTAEPISPIYGYRRTENRWRHFERLSRWPAGLVVMGDATCCFNPVYGQGMTAAALGAVYLDQLLAGRRGAMSSGFGMRFQRGLAKRLAVPWLMATNEDFRWPDTEGERPGGVIRYFQAYIDAVIRLACRDGQASRTFLGVAHLLENPARLFRPGILLRALGEMKDGWK